MTAPVQPPGEAYSSRLEPFAAASAQVTTRLVAADRKPEFVRELEGTHGPAGAPMPDRRRRVVAPPPAVTSP